ncbi:MAG: type IV toxin-antitoxin system AbiEi family antitoxin [bacterium]|nr:type IV toxin-antitoxin system AbiEi family antitoxin [bacterium]
MPTEKEIIERIERGQLSFPPLAVDMLQTKPCSGEKYCADAMIEVSWGEKKAKFIVEFKSLSTPKAFQSALNQLKFLSPYYQSFGLMLIMPFLNDKQLRELEREGISGIDLCGNGVVIVPDLLAVYRSGGKNRFPCSAPIKNIYQKNSSMVGRAFLAHPGYETVQEIREKVNRLNMLVNRWDKIPMSLSTVSKSLKTLEDDLIVERKNGIRLMQADKLLDKLRESYSSAIARKKIRLKISDKNESITKMLWRLSQRDGLPIVATGTSSVAQYAVMQRNGILSVYCPRIERIIEKIPGSQTDRFPNLELVETEDETLFFDAREQQNFWWASPVQVYLELMAGDKRDQETAEQVKSFIMKSLLQEQQ